MKMSGISKAVQRVANKNNPTKGKNYKIRNWHGYNEQGVKVDTNAPAKKLTKLQKAKLKAQGEQKLLETNKTLERSPINDQLELTADFSGEEQGFFKIGNEVFETKFPR